MRRQSGQRSAPISEHADDHGCAQLVRRGGEVGAAVTVERRSGQKLKEASDAVVHEDLIAPHQLNVRRRPVEEDGQVLAFALRGVEAILKDARLHAEEGELLRIRTDAVLRHPGVQVGGGDVAGIADELGAPSPPERGGLEPGDLLEGDAEARVLEPADEIRLASPNGGEVGADECAERGAVEMETEAAIDTEGVDHGVAG